MPKQSLPPQDWDSGLISEGGHFLQSRLWAEFQANLGHQVAWEASNGWRWIAFVERGRWLKYLYCPYGPTVSAYLPDVLNSLKTAAKEVGCDALRIEPRGEFQMETLERAALQQAEIQPQHTSILDLGPDMDALRKGLAEGHRYSVSAAPKRGVTVEVSKEPEEISEFWAMMESTSTRNKFGIHSQHYFETLADTLMPSKTMKLYLARVEGKPAASAISFDFNSTRYYAHAAAFADLSRKAFAGIYLCWQMICDAKAEGVNHFDFWGVAPVGAKKDHPWAGLTQFKRSFGGQDFATAGTWDIPINPGSYRLQSLLRKFL